VGCVSVARVALAILIVSVLLAAPAAAEVQVRVEGGRVDVSAQGAPLGEVLDTLAKRTGARLTYGGASPRRLVTLSITGATPAEAFGRLLEGTGVGFVLRADASGLGVEALHVVDSGTTPTSQEARPARDSSPAERLVEVESQPPGGESPLAAPEPEVGVEPPSEAPAESAPPPDFPPPGMAQPGPEPSSVAGEPGSLAPPSPGPATSAQSGSWPPGMTPIEPEEPSGQANPNLPRPPASSPGTAGPAGAAPPGMRLSGATPSAPPPEPR